MFETADLIVPIALLVSLVLPMKVATNLAFQLDAQFLDLFGNIINV